MGFSVHVASVATLVTTNSPIEEGSTLRAIRRLLLGALVLGTVGTTAELIFIGHYENPFQYTPLILLGTGLLSLGWHLAAPGAAALRALQVVMLLFTLSGAVGIGLHFHGNEEFELEMYPTRSGLELIWKTLSGATPVLAPGSMTLLGVIGLAHTYRHPSAGNRAPGTSRGVIS